MENPFKKTAEKVKNEEITEDKLQEETETAEDSSDNKETADEEIKEEQKNEWQEKYETLNNQYIRLAADFDNFRKRQEQERENLLKYGAENTVKKLIPIPYIY